VKKGFTLRFSSDEALQRQVAAGTVSLYAMAGKQAWRLSLSHGRPVFAHDTFPGWFHEMASSTVPVQYVRTLGKSTDRPAQSSIVWGVQLPPATKQGIASLTRRHYTLPVILGALLLVGCAQHPTRDTQRNDSSLQRWLDAELAPYLAEQLSEHPRFKGESVILVQLDGPDIQPDIDGLTRNLRDQLMDSLLTDAVVRLPWQPQQQQAQHHRRLDQVQCGRIRDASYYIGIEVTRSATAQYRVSVRALDIRAGEWVSGFGKHWSGSLTSSELHALQERRSDESLRGLRVLPFSSGHSDLAATYLANNLSCLLRQQDEEDLVIYVESLKSC
jgi:hypothetical protein